MITSPPSTEVQTWSIDKLVFYKHNPRKNDAAVDRMCGSIREFGFKIPILNWFRAKGEISNGAVEGLNNKIRVVTRRSYGFRTYKAMELALSHNFGRLPEPESPHRFC